jgi:hypothetical protein
MQRHRRSDERDDYDDQPRRPGTSPVLILALVFGGLLVLGVVGCGVFGFLAFRAAPVPAGAPGADVDETSGIPDPKNPEPFYTRQRFRELVMGKTPDEVIGAVGRPDETTEAGDVIRWTYRDRVREPGPGKRSATPVVVFREGKVAEVQY